jgi:hypothetical protein
MRARILKILIALDKLAYQIMTLGYGSEFDTISSAAYRMEQKGRWIGRISRPVIDWIFSKLGGEKHCFTSYISAKYSKPNETF